ncbi:hypothetical protein B0H19DRAFT_1264221 [Mycena capillaripes]|nr:hypothetical protein B0H19DRAFT_1264221 [Mycena capillaripes]
MLVGKVFASTLLVRRVPVKPPLLARISNLPPEFEALVDDRPALPLDAVVSRLAPRTPVHWPAPPKRKDAQTLAREIRASILANDVVAALAILRDLPQPYPRLVVHATVHALLRVSDAPRAGAMLLSFASERAATKPPRIHPTTLAETTKVLLERLPNRQGRQDRVRTASRPNLLVLDPDMVSEPVLRTALALYIQARKLLIPREREATALLVDALFAQREWIPAALMFELQVKDHQLRRTLPTLLRGSDLDAPPLSPHDRDHLGRRLDVMLRENIRVSPALFADLCFRLSGVLASILSNPAGGFAPPAVLAAQKRASAARRVVSDGHDNTSPSMRFPDTDPDGTYALASDRGPPKTPLTPQRAQHHVRVALQALIILGTLLDSRQIPFANISAWINVVGSLPPTMDAIHVYTMVDGRPRSVPARAHLRGILESYVSAMPRVPHIYSIFNFDRGGSIRRGLKHKISAPAENMPEVFPDMALSEEIGSDLGAAEADSQRDHEANARLAVVLRVKRRTEAVDAPVPPLKMEKTRPVASFIRHVPPEDPVEAADDSFMPPPSMPTYEALLGVLLNGGNAGRGGSGPGVLYESVSSKTVTPGQAARPNQGAAQVEAALDAEMSSPQSQADELEARLKHYHAPRSPNNPDPRVMYPAHPLDFDAYPAPVSARPVPRPEAKSELGDIGVTQHRVQLAGRVIAHMLHERSPPLPPWESAPMMRLLARRTDVLQHAVEDWDEVWEGAARARREDEVHASEAQRLEAGVVHHRAPWAQRQDEKEDWAVDENGLQPPREQEECAYDGLDVFSQHLTARTWDTDIDTYYSR